MSVDLPAIEAPRDASKKSWLATANDPACDFPIQNLPFGIFSDKRSGLRRAGVASGDAIVDLAALHAAGKLTLEMGGADVFAQPVLNAFIALGRDAWRSVRIQLSALLGAADAGSSTLQAAASARLSRMATS
jgi:fumarylacetoacetase